MITRRGSALFLPWVLLAAGWLFAAPAHAQPASPEVPAAGAEPTEPAEAPRAGETDDVTVEEEDEAAWNQGLSREERRAVRQLFLEGNRLFRVPLFARAAEQYAAALARWKHPAFYFNLALAQLNLGQDVEARANLERSLEYGQAPLGAEQFEEARKQLRELERQLGRIRVTCKLRGAEVTLDGEVLFTGPGSYQGWVKATPHELTARRAGYLSTDQRVRVEAGKLLEVDLRLITLDEAADKNRRWAVWKPWLVVAGGVAVAAGGGALHALSSRNFTAYDDAFIRLECASASTGCSKADIGAALDDRLQRAELQQKLAIGAYAAGGALLATGAVLLYMNRPRAIEQDAAPSSGRLSVVPELSREAFGLSVSIRH